MPLINFSGLASGIDSEALIKATSDALRAQRVLPSQKKVQDITDTNSALGEIKSKLSALQNKIRAFATISGGPMAKSTTSSDETILTASASNSASNGSYTVRVLQLATTDTFSFNDRFADPGVPVAPGIVDPESSPNARAISITVGSGSPFYIDVSPTTTLSEIASAINNATTDATASVINTGQSPPYALVIKSNTPGTADGQLTINVGDDLVDVGLFMSSTHTNAQDAQFSISGITGTITKSSNTISDVIPGVTFNLIAAAASTDVVINVTDDKAATTTKVQDFVSAYNEIITYMKEQNKIERDENSRNASVIFGPLSTTRIDENAILAIRNAMGESAYTSGTYVRIFADLGVTTERDGTLKFDSAMFNESLDTESTSVKAILIAFGDIAGTTGGTIDQQIRFGGLIDNAVNNNKTQIEDLNDRIAQAETSILKNEEIMRARFARLESLTSQLQSQQAQLTSALAGLQS